MGPSAPALSRVHDVQHLMGLYACPVSPSITIASRSEVGYVALHQWHADDDG